MAAVRFTGRAWAVVRLPGNRKQIPERSFRLAFPCVFVIFCHPNTGGVRASGSQSPDWVCLPARSHRASSAAPGMERRLRMEAQVRQNHECFPWRAPVPSRRHVRSIRFLLSGRICVTGRVCKRGIHFPGSASRNPSHQANGDGI